MVHRVWHGTFNNLALSPLTHFMGASICADVKKRKWKRKNKEVREAFYICQDIRTGGFFLFHHLFIFLNKLKGSLQCYWICASLSSCPLYSSSLRRAMRWAPPAHLVCAQMRPEGCRAWPWGTASWLALTDQGQDLGLLSLVFCVLPAKQMHALRDRGGSRVLYYKVIQTRKY